PDDRPPAAAGRDPLGRGAGVPGRRARPRRPSRPGRRAGAGAGRAAGGRGADRHRGRSPGPLAAAFRVRGGRRAGLHLQLAGRALAGAAGVREPPVPAGRVADQLRFLLEVDALKGVLRQTLVGDGSRRENTAEHSWHAALFALVLAEHAAEPVDAGRAVAMLLVHDLVEVDAGDTY